MPPLQRLISRAKPTRTSPSYLLAKAAGPPAPRQSSQLVNASARPQAKRSRVGGPSATAVSTGRRKQFHAITLSLREPLGRRSQRESVFKRVNAGALTQQQLEKAFQEADTDKDGLLTAHEFRSLVSSRFRLKVVPSQAANTATQRPTNRQLRLVMISSAIPFVGFGFVDNIIMLAAGDMIEIHFHEAYAMSWLVAAALGNTVSDVVGLSLGGIVESFARKLGIPDPEISKAQANMSVTLWANFFASAGGITVGCLLGMFPLLFMNLSDDDDEDDEAAAKKAAKKAEKQGSSEEKAVDTAAVVQTATALVS